MCQVCLLDLEYGIPVQARDTALGIEDESLPESDVGKEFRLKEMENAGLLESSFSKVYLIPAFPLNEAAACLACSLIIPHCRRLQVHVLHDSVQISLCFGQQHVFTAALYDGAYVQQLYLQSISVLSGIHIGVLMLLLPVY